MALDARGPRSYRPLVHHSDRGLQYCCADYIALMEKHGVTISMTETGSPYENAVAERMNGILKDQFGLNRTFSNFEQATEQVHKAIRIYNEKCPHGSCNYLTPQQAHEQQFRQPSKWKQKQKATTVY
jgi:putative transposase